MLTDSSLTNIYLVSGVSQIRYRVYCQSCKRSMLVQFLKCEAALETMARKDSNCSWSRTGQESDENTLIKAYRNLVALNIPCMWKGADTLAGAAPDTPRDMEPEEVITLELWVFWFDDRHTGQIDDNVYLRELEEIKMGSFTWETTVGKNLSPTASPVGSMAQSAVGINPVVTVAKEYKLFLQSIENLLRGRMVRKGALPLGDFYVFPSSFAETDVTREIWPDTVQDVEHDNSVDSLLTCTYNIYLSNTNLIVQPDVRRMGIRPLTHSDVKAHGTKVIMCPTGEVSTIASVKRDIPSQLEEHTLHEWSRLYDIPLERLYPRQRNLCHDEKIPALVPIRTLPGEVVLYPSNLLFVTTSPQLSPTSVRGMSGILGYNQGFTEDLGEKWSRWAWRKRSANGVKRNATYGQNMVFSPVESTTEQSVNYWSYGNSSTITAILEALSVVDSANTHSLLQKALSEPVSSSPIMVSKAAATPASSGTKIEPAANDGDEETVERVRTERFRNQNQLSLAEFASRHFGGEDKRGFQPGMNYTSLPEHSGQRVDSHMPTGNSLLPSAPVPDSSQMSAFGSVTAEHLMYDQTSALYPGAAVVRDISASTGQNNTGNFMYRSPQLQPTEEGFGLGFGIDSLSSADNMMYGLPNRWGDDTANLDNDFDVTEEDFNFFESGPTRQQDMFQEAGRESNESDGNNSFQPGQSTSTEDTNPTLMLVDTVPLQALNTGDISHSNETLNLDDILAGSEQFLDNQLLLGSEMHSTMRLKAQKSPVAPAVPDEATTDSATDIRVGPIEGRGSSSTDDIKAEGRCSNDKMVGQNVRALLDADTTLEQNLVPPDFAPVTFTAGVNDSKYFDGGKFMYLARDEGNSRSRRHDLKRDPYRPDYVPKIRKRTKTKQTAEAKASSKEDAVATDSRANYNATTRLVAGEGSPPSESLTSDDSISDSDTSDTSEEAEQSLDWWMAGLRHAEARFVDRIFSRNAGQKLAIKEPKLTELSLDSPFPSAVTSGALEAQSLHIRDHMQDELKALDYLCQQVVLGGYPFTNGLASLSANGGEVSEGESVKVLLNRRRGLLQAYCGDVLHAPTLQSDYDRITHIFKEALIDIFDHASGLQSDNIEQLDMAPPSFPGSVAIKGPLSVQQYYDLSETNQAQSKYGKYQVKKRRPAEPNLDTLPLPYIVVSRQDDFIEGSPKLVTFWEKLRLEPYSARKNVSYFVVFPSNEHLESSCVQFFKSLSTVYESCHLGVHYPGNIGPYRRGLVPVPLLPEITGETWNDQQLRSYMAECQNLGAALGGIMAEKMHIVVYLVNPASSLSSNFDLSKCFNKLMMAYHAASIGMGTRTSQENRARIVMQLIPMEHILRPSSFGGYQKFGLKELAFSVYSKCHAVVRRDRVQASIEDTGSVTAMYAPAFVLAKTIPESIQYSLTKPVIPFHTIVEQNATLHLAYCFSLDRRWMTAVWTDNRGELLEFAVLYSADNKPLGSLFEEAWCRTTEISQRTGHAWTFVIAKIGLMFHQELQDWTEVIPADTNAVIVCMDMESALHVHAGTEQQATYTNIIDYPQTPGSANTPTPEVFSTPTPIPTSTGTANIRNDSNGSGTTLPDDATWTGEARALLLNHRIAYSQRRVRIAQGIIQSSIGQLEDSWMLPLASGYFIHSMPKSENPCREQFNNDPFIMEIHLVHNQTNHSAYSILRDIIKQYHALSYINVMPSSSNCLPVHVVITERLERILLVVSA